jgi:hypothetical protein
MMAMMGSDRTGAPSNKLKKSKGVTLRRWRGATAMGMAGGPTMAPAVAIDEMIDGAGLLVARRMAVKRAISLGKYFANLRYKINFF